MHPSGVCQALIPLLMAAVVGCVQVSERSVGLASERSSIERTYELTKYLDHQLKEIKDTYLSYLGPPFNDPDFSPPRPNSSALALPSAATRVDLWRGLENGARLAQNQRAYSVLLCAVRELARSTLCPYLQSSLLHFCSGLSGLLGSISGLMNTLGYTPPPLGQAPPSLHSPAPLRSPTLRNHEQRGSAGTAGGSREGERDTERRRERERERAERGRRGRRREEESWAEAEEEELARHGGMERWGRRRRLLSMEEEQSKRYDYNPNNNNNNNRNGNSAINSFHNNDTSTDISINTNVNTNRRANGPIPTVTERNKAQELSREEEGGKTREAVSVLLYSSPSLHPRRSRSLPSPQPPLSPLSLLYQYGGAVTDGHSLLTTPVISYRPAPNDFSRKVEGFWVLRELQSWLWRSAKDFNRLKKRLRA